MSGVNFNDTTDKSVTSAAAATLTNKVIDPDLNTVVLEDGKILVGDGTDAAAPVPLSGDATIDNTGELTLVNTAVTPGSYTTADITVDAKGRITSAANGSGVTGLTSINTDNTAAQTIGVGTSGTDFAIVDGGGGAHTLNLPTASASNRGALSTSDWSTFNAKLTSTLAQHKIFIGSSGNAAVAQTMSGDATLIDTGALTLANTAVTPASYTLTNLTVDSKGRITAASNGTAPAPDVKTKTANFTITSAEDVLLADTSGGSFTLTMPTASAKKIVRIKMIGSGDNALTIARAGSDTIDGEISQTLNAQYQAIELVSDGGTSWYVL